MAVIQLSSYCDRSERRPPTLKGRRGKSFARTSIPEVGDHTYNICVHAPFRDTKQTHLNVILSGEVSPLRVSEV